MFKTERYTISGNPDPRAYQWPSGFAGTGWAVVDPDGDVVARFAFRVEALNEIGRQLERLIEYANDAGSRSDGREADRWYARARRLENERCEALGLCQNCKGTGRVWDGSGYCANHQTSRVCPLCDGDGQAFQAKVAAMREP